MPRSRSAEPVLALTVGDPAGIGPDIAIAAWLARRALALPPFALFADPAQIAARARRLGETVTIAETDLAGAAGAPKERTEPARKWLDVVGHIAKCGPHLIGSARLAAEVWEWRGQRSG